MITIKTKTEIEFLRQGGRILGEIMKQLINEVKPGVTTGHLEEMANFLIKKNNGRPSFKGYTTGEEGDRPYPTALCASINNEVVHTPSLPSRTLKEGDIITIDMGMEYPFGKGAEKGFYTDMAVSAGAGKISPEAKKLIKITKQALLKGLSQIKPGNSLNQIGKAVEKYVVKNSDFSVVRDLVGHGVGYEVHEDPQIPNYGTAYNKTIILKPGMVLAVEPMVNAGGYQVKLAQDGFTFITADGSLSAQFEHTIVVTEKGYEILTKYE